MDGLHKVWPRKSFRIRPAKVKITIGKAFYAKDIIAASEPSNNEQAYENVTAHLKQTIARMIDDMRS